MRSMLRTGGFSQENHGGYVGEEQAQARGIAGAALAHGERCPANAQLDVSGGRRRFRENNNLNAVRCDSLL
jgi:hypothetical protein